jgi:methylglyoxal synthase
MDTIAIIAHNNTKQQLIDWAREKVTILTRYNLIATHQTAMLLKEQLGLNVKPYIHGPEGGDIQIAAQILEGGVQMLIFFIDAQSPHGHEHDIQTLIRISVIKNIPIALNQASADLLLQKYA